MIDVCLVDSCIGQIYLCCFKTSQQPEEIRSMHPQSHLGVIQQTSEREFGAILCNNRELRGPSGATVGRQTPLHTPPSAHPFPQEYDLLVACLLTIWNVQLGNSLSPVLLCVRWVDLAKTFPCARLQYSSYVL